MEPKKRLSLVERQEIALGWKKASAEQEETVKGVSRPSKPPTAAAAAAAKQVLSSATPSSSSSAAGAPQRRGSKGAPSVASTSASASSQRTNVTLMSFTERNEDLLVKQGRGNATSFSRVSVPMVEVEGNEDVGDGQSVCSRASKAPSLHPSMAGSTYSMACSEVTVGAGDDTGYWDFQHRRCLKNDLAHMCIECKRPFTKLGEPITERRGARTSYRYHAECFSGFADPRSQSRSSHHEGHLAGSQLAAAPTTKCGTKMRASCHFDGRSDRQKGQVAVSTGSMGGKFGGAMGMGSNNFGSKSSKNQGVSMAEVKRAPGGFTEEELAAFTAAQEEVPSGTTRFSLGSIEEMDALDPVDDPV